ncbi:hypothetical protein GALL_400690 [mine drainage metagenome]|uniref:Uncharacterized protein n=1 Tax=mine drainage metagenome TaxID=410659 RepID=A0A1J5QL40_9ZZZZ
MGGEGFRLGARGVNHPLEHLVRQKLHILGKHAKYQPVDEVRRGLGIVPPASKALGKCGEALGGFLG